MTAVLKLLDSHRPYWLNASDLVLLVNLEVHRAGERGGLPSAATIAKRQRLGDARFAST